MWDRKTAVMSLGEKIGNQLLRLKETELMQVEGQHEKLMFLTEASLLASSVLYVCALNARVPMCDKQEARMAAKLYAELVSVANESMQELIRSRCLLN